MKNTLYFAAIAIMTVIFLYSCSSDNAVTPPLTGLSNISGSVLNWTHGTQKVFAKVYDSTYTNHKDLDSGTINSSGAFSLNLPAVPSNFLTKFVPNDTSCPGNVTVTPAYTRFTSLNIEVRDNSGNHLGNLTKKNYDSTYAVGSFYMSYDYFETATTITGQSVCYMSDTTIFNLSEVAGWNKEAIQVLGISGPYPNRLQVTNTEPAGGQWYMH